MLLYSGGTIIHHELDHYSFLGNFFSDLGRVKTFSGASNFPVYLIFSFSAIVAGLSTSIFFFFFASLFEQSFLRPLIIIGQLAGILAGFCFVGIGFTPWDIYKPEHVLFVKAGFSFFLFSSFACSVAMYKYPGYPNFYVIVYWCFLGILAAYLYLLFFGPNDMTSARDMGIQVIAQKILLYCQMFCMSIQAFGAYKLSVEKKNLVG